MKRYKGLCICLILVILTFGLGFLLRDWFFTPEAAPSKYGGILRLGGLGGPPSIINPILTERTVSKALVGLIFNGLVRLDKEMIPQPDLAKSWDISDDGLTYTFYLRQDVKFHDGVELTAEDVKFTYELVTDPKINSPWRSYFESIKEWQATDKYTFKISLKEPFALSLNTLTEHIVIPRHILEGKDIKTTTFNRHPIGSGPFRFAQWTENDKIILEANRDYFEGRPYLDRIIARGYEDTTTFWGGFMRGEIDAVFFLSKEDFETVRRDKDFKTYAFPYIWTYALDYNLEHPLLRDKKVRQALAHAIDIRNIIDKVEDGYGMASTGPFLPGSWSYNPDIKPLEYNPSRALELLREVGWDLNEQGILEKDGQEFRFTMLVNTELKDIQMIAMLIHQELYKLGIRIDIKALGHRESGKEQYKQLIYQAGAYLTIFSIRADPAELVHDWHSGFKQRHNKLYEYKNSEIEAFFEQGRLTHDIKQRQKTYQRIHELIYDGQPAMFLYFPYHLGAINARFHDTDELFSATMPFYTIKDWYLQGEDTK